MSSTMLPNITNETMQAPFKPRQDLLIFGQINLNIALVFLMIGLGCTIEWKDIKKIFQRPIPVTVGALCQFGIMPLIGFTLAILFQLPANVAIGTILIATCPGGTASNIMTYWSEGDITLSVCMTFVSNVLAIGMMPWCLFLYSQYWIAISDVIIPSPAEIAIALAIMLIPGGIGMLVRWKWPRFSEKLSFVLNIIVNFQLIIFITINVVVFPPIFATGWREWCVGTLYPFTAFVVGYFLSRLLGLKPKQSRTVAFETGVQNGALALSLINYLILQGYTNQLEMMTIPMIHTIFAMVEGFIIVILYWVYKKCILKEKGGLLSNRMKTVEKFKVKKEKQNSLESISGVSMVDVGVQVGM
ncbi:ileal sodium/bile acid cotransporter-like [Saccoglossus kowalevskii]|uniref:Ileal sodium/bile acid cotransporter-like n=1 Tax=Saccoglossus kowalevskii TaxID=10224 RepID=A0ABM0MZH1_SACKO|nr:PREDICTED: ileal sodium/bile acid cotransporter-like [Saccoglossus kowalevskii]